MKLQATLAILSVLLASACSSPKSGTPKPSSGAPTGTPDSFLVHFSEATRGVGVERAKSVLAECGPDAGPDGPPCWELKAVGDDGTMVEAIPEGRPRTLRAAGGLGAAWDEAYSMRREIGAERVEPQFEVDMRSRGVEDGVGARGGERPDKAAAAADTEWSLKHINAFAAWDLIHETGHGDGEEGKSVVIGHPDTGYRQHLEYWAPNEPASPVLFNHGYDFFRDDDDALDELDTGGAIPNPGHGTSSGSVIVSPKGKQWVLGQSNEYVSGVAPAARLVPLRVHRSVVHFHQRRMTQAILEAAGMDRTKVKLPVQVISISMGGVPSYGLWKAVRFAKKQGVIVVAAAGNEVGFVVWPGRFKDTIAVAASNVECGTWEGSSHGSAVDITAPGESVWRATTTAEGVNTVGMGQGTTYATATAAGVAALWLDYHRDDPDVTRAKEEGRVTDIFRHILQDTSWRPGETPPPDVSCTGNGAWDSEEFGPGIIDAAAALGAPLSAARSAVVRDTEFETLPLFYSFFERPVTGEEVGTVYRRLLRIDADRAIADDAELEGEVAYHYALDIDVRKALDGAIQQADATDADFAGARESLLSRDISSRLRSALAGGGQGD